MRKDIRKNYLNKIQENSISVFFAGEEILSNADAKYNFAVNNHFFYLTGINKPKSALILINENGNHHEYLFIERNTELIAKWDGARMSPEEAVSISGFKKENIKFYDEFKSTIDTIKSTNKMHNTGEITDYFFTLNNKDEFRQRKFINDFKQEYPNVVIKDSFKTITELRTIKLDGEIELTKKAIDITKDGILSLMKNAKNAKTENELEAYYNFELKKNDVTNSFSTIAACGVNATVLHYVDNNAKLNKDDLILFDLGVKYKGYCSDISRTIPVSGKFTEEQKTIYNIVLKANKVAIDAVKPGVTWPEINKIARDILVEGMIGLGYIKEEKEIYKYYFHGLGHYLGLDVHDDGIYSKPLEEGNLLTIEPGLYIPEANIGIRIEDDIVVTKDGCINLSANIIKEVEEIEEMMAGE